MGTHFCRAVETFKGNCNFLSHNSDFSQICILLCFSQNCKIHNIIVIYELRNACNFLYKLIIHFFLFCGGIKPELKVRIVRKKNLIRFFFWGGGGVL